MQLSDCLLLGLLAKFAVGGTTLLQAYQFEAPAHTQNHLNYYQYQQPVSTFYLTGLISSHSPQFVPDLPRRLQRTSEKCWKKSFMLDAILTPNQQLHKMQ